MEKTYLLQRLISPLETANPFSFGGGLPNGGIVEELMQKLVKIWSFDYMGSAEFEWGAVPEALEQISKNPYLIAGKMNIQYSVFNGKQVYYICGEEDEEDVKRRINQIARNKLRLREPALMEYDKIKGWLELDNGFLFFVDKNMFDKAVNLFMSRE